MKKKLVVLLSSGFGTGLGPFASGTTGSLPGVLLVMAMAPLAVMRGGWLWQLLIGLVLAGLAVPLCGAAEAIYGRKDDGRIVADEFLTFPLCVIGLPWVEHPWLLAVAFVVNRGMDILKPPPARQAQALRGGVGIVIDDVISCFYALLVNHAIAGLLL